MVSPGFSRRRLETVITFSTNDKWRLGRIADVDVFKEVVFVVGFTGVASPIRVFGGVETELFYVDGPQLSGQARLDDF